MIQALNSNTTWGLDGSQSNNFGLGSGFRSTAALAGEQRMKDAAPSWWWLVGFIVLVWVLG